MHMKLDRHLERHDQDQQETTFTTGGDIWLKRQQTARKEERSKRRWTSTALWTTAQTSRDRTERNRQSQVQHRQHTKWTKDGFGDSNYHMDEYFRNGSPTTPLRKRFISAQRGKPVKHAYDDELQLANPKSGYNYERQLQHSHSHESTWLEPPCTSNNLLRAHINFHDDD